MYHQRVLTNFAQQDLEPLQSARCKYKDLLINNNFSKECQLQIFLNSLCDTIRMWVES